VNIARETNLPTAIREQNIVRRTTTSSPDLRVLHTHVRKTAMTIIIIINNDNGYQSHLRVSPQSEDDDDEETSYVAMCSAVAVIFSSCVTVVVSAALDRSGDDTAAEKVLETTGVHGVGARNAATAAVRPRRRRPAGRCRGHRIHSYDKFCRATRADANGTCIIHHHAYIIIILY